jgi:hypothetical protein
MKKPKVSAAPSRPKAGPKVPSVSKVDRNVVVKFE